MMEVSSRTMIRGLSLCVGCCITTFGWHQRWQHGPGPNSSHALLTLHRPFDPAAAGGAVEKWLIDCEAAMRGTLK